MFGFFFLISIEFKSSKELTIEGISKDFFFLYYDVVVFEDGSGLLSIWYKIYRGRDWFIGKTLKILYTIQGRIFTFFFFLYFVIGKGRKFSFFTRVVKEKGK